MAIADKIFERLGRAIAMLGIVVRTSSTSSTASDPTIGAGAAASAGTEPNGSLWLATDAPPRFRIGSAWKYVALLGGTTNDMAYTATSADELLNVDLSMNHATAQGVAVDAAAIQLTTARTSGIMAAVASACTSLAGDSGGTYADVWCRAPTDGGGSATHVGLLVSAGHDATIDASASATGENDWVIGNNLADALSERDAAGNVYRTLVSTTGALAFNVKQRLTTTDGVASGDARVVGGRAYALTAAGTSLTGTASETVLGSYSIPANTLKAGSTLRARWKVKVTADSGATTLTVRARLGATTLTGTVLTATSAVDTSSGDLSSGWLELVARAAPGASVAVEGVGYYSDPAAAGGAMKVASLDATNLATNGALLFEVTGQWSAGDANACQLEHLTIEIV